MLATRMFFQTTLSATLLLLAAAAAPLRATTFNVNSGLDGLDFQPGNGVCVTDTGTCTLRAAIIEANSAPGGPHTVVIPAGSYRLSIPGIGEDAARMGDLDLQKTMTIQGAGSGVTIVDGAGLDRVFDVPAGINATFVGLTIRGGDLLQPGNKDAAGGGIRALGGLSLTDVVVTGNRANQGGGVIAYGTVTIDQTTFSENLALDFGSTLADGGGLYLEHAAATITRSTFRGNSAISGGGIFAEDGTLSLENVTISGNVGVSVSGMFCQNNVTTLTHVTLVASGATPALKTFSSDTLHTTTLKNTVLAGDVFGSNCSVDPQGTLKSAGGNLDTGVTCALSADSDLVGLNARLGPLSNSGGPTATHPPLPGSPLIDAALTANCTPLDQRGFSRPFGSFCDIGAVELDSGASFTSTRFVPILLDRVGGASFTSQLSIANRSTRSTSIFLTYTAATSLSSTGSGTAIQTLGPGQQLAIDDALAYLRGAGIPIPDSPNQGGTLRVQFPSAPAPYIGFAGARTTAPAGPGRAGLAYPGSRAEDLLSNAVYVFGLRDTGADRTNLALMNAGTAGTITLRVTLIPALAPGSTPVVLPEETLGPGQWKQINAPDLLRRYGFTNAYARVERISGIDPFLTYAVFNDNDTNDGSYVPAVLADRIVTGLVVPVVVESPTFESELVFANPSDVAVEFDLVYTQSRGTPTGTIGVPVAFSLQPHQQRIYPHAIQFLRDLGVPIPPRGGDTLVGTIRITLVASQGRTPNAFAGARTAAPAATGGAYGLFAPAFPPEEGVRSEAWIYGLETSSSTRSNLAVLNLGDGAATQILSIDVYDATNGALFGTLERTLPPGGWDQVDGILSIFGLTHGYARVRKISGKGHFAAYGVTNDGNQIPGTNDGSYLAMVPVE